MILAFFVCLLASIAGAICGIGGGIIIKPSMDFFGLMDVASASFLSGCTVLAMSAYSMTKRFLSRGSSEEKTDMVLATQIAVGAVVGGILGNFIFSYVEEAFGNPNITGAIQSICIFLLTVGTLIYTLLKKRIKTKNVKGALKSMGIGLLLGTLSSFLGIGGGPLNLVVLFYFYSMATKPAAEISLYIIMLSQLASLATSLTAGTVPGFELTYLLAMVGGGIAGGIIGRAFNKKLSSDAVEKLFIWLMVIIIGISVYNSFNFIF